MFAAPRLCNAETKFVSTRSARDTPFRRSRRVIVSIWNQRGMPQTARPSTAKECYRNAMDARRMAVASRNADEKIDFFEVEQGWLALARRCELEQRSEGRPQRKPGR
jgi:hypothetical protein